MAEQGRHNAEFIETTDEDGIVHIFERVDEVELDGQRYALLIYQGKGGEDGQVEAPEEEGEDGYEEELVIMRVIHEDDGDVFESIEDEAEFEKVLAWVEEWAELESEDDEEGDDEDGEEVESANGKVSH